MTWRLEAACRDLNPSTFYPDIKRGEITRGGERLHPAVAAALAVCDRCPVNEPCLRWALALNEQEGVWGNKTAGERRTMRRKGLHRQTAVAS